MNINEEFLHFIWKCRLYKLPLIGDHGNEIEVLDPGQYNKDAGPDFFNAKIKVNQTIWAGNIEIHQKASDWYKHKHDDDPAYNNVILHVVHEKDIEIKTREGFIVPAIKLVFNRSLYDNYTRLLLNDLWIPCEKQIQTVDPFIINLWLDRIGVERIEEKAGEVQRVLSERKGDWLDTVYRFLSRNLGFKINALPFELLAKSIPLKILLKHKENLFQLEALLFGQAGFLFDQEGDEYYRKLVSEYHFLENKYKLEGIGKHLWKFLRLRPVNFPTIRIAQFASLVYNQSDLFNRLLNLHDLDEVIKIFRIKASSYWDNHYQFNKVSVNNPKFFGMAAIHNIIINTLVPVLFEHGRVTGNSKERHKAIQLLEELYPEKNSIIRKWENLGIKAINAFYSQSLLYLKKSYCNCKKCLYCTIGNQIIQTNTDETGFV